GNVAGGRHTDMDATRSARRRGGHKGVVGEHLEVAGGAVAEGDGGGAGEVAAHNGDDAPADAGACGRRDGTDDGGVGGLVGVLVVVAGRRGIAVGADRDIDRTGRGGGHGGLDEAVGQDGETGRHVAEGHADGAGEVG